MHLWALYRLGTALQILIFLPLTLATLSRQAFLLQSLLLTSHALIHGTMAWLWRTQAISFLQVPMHPFILLLCFNIFSTTAVNPWLLTAANMWGHGLKFSGPLFIGMEGMSSLLVAQKIGQEGKKLVDRGESYQFGMLIAAAAAYVTSAWWIVVVRGFVALVTCRTDPCIPLGFPNSHTRPPLLHHYRRLFWGSL